MTYQRLIVERRGPVRWIINNRPDRLNAYDAVMREEFPRAWGQLDADPEVRVIVHTGNGRAFQVGADVDDLDGDGVRQFQETMRTLNLKLTGWHCNVGKPVITAVNGVCAGGGCTGSPTPTSSSPPRTPPSSTPMCQSAKSAPWRPSR